MLIGSAELSRLQFAGKIANCTRSTTSNSHYGANLWSENESMSVKHWKTTSREADELYSVLRCTWTSPLKREGKNWISYWPRGKNSSTLVQKLCFDLCAQKVYLEHNSPQNSSGSYCKNSSNLPLGHLKVDWFLFLRICAAHRFVSRKSSAFCHQNFHACCCLRNTN